MVITGLNDVVDSINSGNCDLAAGELDEAILSMIAIQLIQGTLKYASFNAGLSPGTEDGSLAIGDTFSRSILPQVDQSHSDSAQIISTQMQFQLTSQPVPDGFSAVADAMRQALPAMDGHSSVRYEITSMEAPSL